jgi:hypothetical protein
MTLPRYLFWGSFATATALSLVAFTVTIGSGRLTGPGICLALSVGALVWVGRMLFESARALVATGVVAEAQEERAASGRRRKELEREYYTLKRALKELELDHAMGKISPTDYNEIRSRYRERAVRILRQLDEGQGQNFYRSQLEADLKARRAALGLPDPLEIAAAESPAVAAAPADPETAPATAAPLLAEPKAVTPNPEAPAAFRELPSPLCPACATRNDGDAVFCKKCGHRLKAA